MPPAEEAVPKPKLLQNFGKAIAVCSFITLINDLLEPLGPMAMVALVLSVAALFVTVVFGRTFAKWKNEVVALKYSAALIGLVSAFLLYYQSIYPEVADNGLIASKIPAATELQVLIGISNDISDIKKYKIKIAENIPKMKKEISEDPQKELSNLGVLWSHENFMEALRTGNARVVGLFLRSGLLPQARVLRLVASAFPSSDPNRPRTSFYTPEIASLLSQPNLFDPVAACVMDAEFLFEALSHPERGRFLRQVCSVAPVIARAKAEREKAAKALAEAQAFNRNRKVATINCVADLKRRLPFQQMFERASRFNILNAHIIVTPEELALAELNTRLLVGHIDNPDRIYADVVTDACAKANSLRHEDSAVLQRWQMIVDGLSG